MFRSLKSKISLTVALFIMVVLLLFSALIFVSSIKDKEVITPRELIEMPFLRPGQQRFLMENERIEEIVGIVEIIREEQRREYIESVILIALALTLISAFASYFVAKYLLRPIDTLTGDIKKIGPESLHKRLKGKYKADEVEFLADNFNELLDKLEKAFELEEQFIADAAHELRTPIASIKSNIEVAKKYPKKMTIEQYEYIVNTIDSLNEKLISLNEKLLFLNRKTEEGEYKIVNINGLIEDIVEQLSALAHKNEVEIKLNLAKDDLNILLHARNISKALSNIIENSIKYKREGVKSFVSIKTELIDGKVIVTIKDNGIGIAKKDQQKIFERFYRADNARDLTGLGEGLGLSITKKIIEDHNGVFELSSSLNKGTQMKLVFTQSKAKNYRK